MPRFTADLKSFVRQELIPLMELLEFDLTIESDKDVLSYADNESATLTVSFKNINGVLTGKTLNYTITHENTVLDTGTVTTDSNGEASIVYQSQAAGDVLVEVSYANLIVGTYELYDVHVEFDTSDLTKYYRCEQQFIANVYENGQLVTREDEEYDGCTATLAFYYETIDLCRKYNAEYNGVKLNINLQPGEYSVVTKYKTHGRLFTTTNTVIVNQILFAEDLTKKYGTADQFVATLIDCTGNPFPGEKVSFNLAGVNYNRTTDSNGQAKLNIKNQAGEYIITSSYNGTSIANTITVTD